MPLPTPDMGLNPKFGGVVILKTFSIEKHYSWQFLMFLNIFLRIQKIPKMLLPTPDMVLNPKFCIVIPKTVTCRSWTDTQSNLQG